MPTPTTNPFPYAKVYEEENAILVSESREYVENAGTAIRRFNTDVPAGEWDAIILEMWQARMYVDNPVIDKNADAGNKFRLRGRWGVSHIRKSTLNEIPGIYEELRLGFLQPPGTANDYPKTLAAGDWSFVDSQARVIRCNEFDATQRIVSGKNQYYTVIYPRVASATIKEFCSQLTARPTIDNPVFGLQTNLKGLFKFAGVVNEENGDGSSNVKATLAYADGFEPSGVVFNNDWRETFVRIWNSNLPLYPTQLPHADLAAVDDPTNWRNQLSPATIYRVVDARMSDEGLWEVDIDKRTAKPSVMEIFVNDADGSYANVMFWNQTLAWVQNYMTLAISVNNRNLLHPPQRNEFDLYDGHLAIHPTPAGFGSYYSTGWFFKNVIVFRHGHDGRYIREVWRLRLRRRFGGMRSSTNNHEGLTSVAQGQDFFYNGTDGVGLDYGIQDIADPGGPPLEPWSTWQELGGGQYRFQRVVKAELITRDATNAYNVLSDGALKVMVASDPAGDGGPLPTS